MSEQYRCTECGHFVEIQDDVICDVCHVGKMEHLRYIKGGNGSHWDGCVDVHWDCKIAQLEAELARRDEIITQLKEDAIRLADGLDTYWQSIPEGQSAITLHRALMKELEEK